MRIAIVFIFILCSSASGQINYDRLTMENGLPHNQVSSLLYDNDGYLWLGTSDGLCKYDGYSFTIFKHDPDDSLSISHNEVRSIYQDSKGTIWVGTTYGLNKYDLAKNWFTRFLPSRNDSSSLHHGTINCIVEDENNTIWVGTNGGGLSQLNKAHEKFKTFRFGKSGITQDYIYDIVPGKNNTLWLGLAGYGLDVLNIESGKFQNFRLKGANAKTSFKSNVLRDLSWLDGKLWITSLGGLHSFNPKTMHFDRHYDLSNSNLSVNSLSELLPITTDSVLVTTSSGVKAFSIKQEVFASVFTDALSGEAFRIIKDPMGMVWICENEKGIIKIPHKSNIFSHKYFPSVGFITKMMNLPSGGMLISTKNGYFLYQKEQLTPVLKDISASARDFHLDKFGTLWIASNGYGLYKVSPETFQIITHYAYSPNDKNSINYNEVTDIDEDGEGNLWIGTNNGLAFYDQSSESIERYDQLPFYDRYITTLYVESDSVIWFGTSYGGINKFNKNQLNLEYFYHSPNGGGQLTNNHIFNITPLNDSILMVGTKAGLNFFNKRDGQLVDVLDRADGMLNEIIRGVVKFNKELWISTNYGLSHYDIQTQKLKNYVKNDGLLSNINAVNACLKLNNQLYFAHDQGFTVVNTLKKSKLKPVPLTQLTGLKIFHEEISHRTHSRLLNKHISQTDSILLNYDQNTLSISFTAPQFINPDKVIYQYRLKGFDTDWVFKTSENRLATYTNLEEGKYLFEVKASNEDGIWSKSPTTLQIEILPPPWRTWWAYLMYIVLILLAFSLVVRVFVIREKLKSRARLERLELAKVKELDQLKSRFFTNISHELRTPLTLILTPLNGLIEKSEHADDKNLFK